VKPGPGWTNVGGSVWTHPAGIRLHTLGFALFDNRRELIAAFQWPETRVADRFIRIAGGNQKRGLMLWALDKVTPAVARSASG